ncbi:MAG: hypothetical protein ABJD97_05915 [Betaproteobacteria bacterium]
MSDNPPAPPAADDDLLAQADALHDDEPQRGLEMLRRVRPDALSPGRLPRLAFLLNHVFGEKFDLWGEALVGQRAIVERLGVDVTPVVLRQAAIAAQVAGDTPQASAWTQRLAACADAPLAKARALVTLGAVAFSVGRQSAENAGRLTLQALAPLAALHATPGNGLDGAFGAVTNNLASELLERPFDDLGQPDLRTALELTAEHANRFWKRAGTWLNHERAHYLCAMSANALGHAALATTQARAGLALLDVHDDARQEDVDRAFLELELALGLRLLAQPGQADALARADGLAARFDDASLEGWFAGRRARNEALAAHYGR